MEHSALKIQLEERLAVLQARLLSLKRDVSRSHSGDSAEQAQERENDEVLDVIGNETSLSIERVRAALQRMEHGVFGVCDRCGGPIADARLQVMPEAIRCLDCAR
jgi:DnaK suppressor protein